MLYGVYVEDILITYQIFLVFFTTSLFLLWFLFIVYCLWGIWSADTTVTSWMDRQFRLLDGWMDWLFWLLMTTMHYVLPVQYRTEIKTPFTMLGHWSHQAFISLLRRVGLLQLTAEQWRAVTCFSDFWLHWWILVSLVQVLWDSQ